MQKYSKIVYHNKTERESKPAQKVERINHHLGHKPSDKMDLLISWINGAGLGWKADACKLQEHHQDYCQNEDDAEEDVENVDDGEEEDNLVELDEWKDFAGVDDKEFAKTLEQAQQYQKKYKSANEIPDSELPQNYDFRNINGYDFTNRVRDQDVCGACYTLAFNQAIESRLKLRYGKKMPVLSAQQVLNCNFLTEGCQGGLPHLNGLFMEQAYLVGENCAPYQGKTKGVQCK